MTKKLAVIVPIYNQEENLTRCLFSLLSQMTKECELILVDDGSTDNSMRVAKRLVPASSNYKIIKKKNGGLSDARNAGLACVDADYVAFVDSDDYVAETYVETILSYIKNNKPDLIMFGYNVVSRSDGLISVHFADDGYNNINEKNVSMLGYAWNKVYKTSIIKNNELSFEVGTSYIEDILFNEKYIKNIQELLLIKENLYNYVQYDTPTLGNKIYNNLFELDVRANNALRVILESLKLPQNDIDELCNQNIIKRISYSIMRIIKSNKKEALHDYSGYIKKNKIVSSDRKESALLFAIKHRMVVPMKMYCVAKDFGVKKIIPFSVKFRLKTILHRDNGKYSKKTKKIFIFLAANYGNLGDVLITEAQEKFLSDLYPEHILYKVYVDQVESELKSICKNKNKDDVYTVIGGGNMGDKYGQLEYMRQYIIKKLGRSKVILFPQTLTTNENKDKDFLKRTQHIYDRKNILLFCRDKKTFDNMKSVYKKATVALCPDIALYLCSARNGIDKNTENVILFCCRNDSEKDGDLLPNISKINKYKILFKDTQIDHDHLSEDERQIELDKLINVFERSSIVVTNRLHGMILAKIMKRPFIAMDNYNKKISRVYNCWLSEEDGIVIDDIDEVDVELLTNMIKKYSPSEFDKSLFNEMKSIVMKFVGQ